MKNSFLNSLAIAVIVSIVMATPHAIVQPAYRTAAKGVQKHKYENQNDIASSY